MFGGDSNGAQQRILVTNPFQFHRICAFNPRKISIDTLDRNKRVIHFVVRLNDGDSLALTVGTLVFEVPQIQSTDAAALIPQHCFATLRIVALNGIKHEIIRVVVDKYVCADVIGKVAQNEIFFQIFAHFLVFAADIHILSHFFHEIHGIFFVNDGHIYNNNDNSKNSKSERNKSNEKAINND